MRFVVAALDWLTMNNVLHLPRSLHWKVVAAANRLAERIPDE